MEETNGVINVYVLVHHDYDYIRRTMMDGGTGNSTEVGHTLLSSVGYPGVLDNQANFILRIVE